MSQIFKPFVTQHFFDIRDFFTIANPDFELQERMKVAFARMIPKSSDPDALGLKHAAQEVQDVVGLPFNQWHAGHLASLKGKTLPAWDKQETTVLALQSLDNLLELEKRKMETMSQLKCVLVGQALMQGFKYTLFVCRGMFMHVVGGVCVFCAGIDEVIAVTFVLFQPMRQIFHISQ